MPEKKTIPDRPEQNDMPLSIHVGINVDGAVQINLNKAIAAIALDSKTAVEIGVMLIQHAAIVDNAAMDMVAAEEESIEPMNESDD